MEDVLDLYHEDYDPDHPVVCFDETSKQLVADKRPSIGAKPGRVERYDYEYKRNGTRNLFMFCEPKAGWRHVEVTERRTAVDFAHQMRWLADEAYPHTKTIRLVLDNPQIPHLTLLVWDLWFYRTCSLSTRRHICSDWAVKRVSGDVFESSGAPHMPNGGSLEAKEGMTRHGNSAELPSTDGLGKAAYAQGSAASADILWRALSSNSYEGWPRARRMINLLA